MTALDSSLMVYARIDNPEEALRYQPGRFSSASDSILVINPIKPRAMHHKLLLPRLSMGHLRGTAIPESDVHSLQQLFDSVHAEEVFEIFAAEADAVERDIRVSMREEHGFEWEIHMGFHAASKKGPVHLHVFSADLLGVPFTSAKEYNEFNVHNDYLQLLDDLRGPGKNHYVRAHNTSSAACH
ncbi:uncharacterized protein JCM10292_007444 [Rhodotorula paludigena]|uniref:uncharacterized protein n=1 Tax=Rhodotorula paludigena TaxID=86838 RepID=UPI0031730614